LKVPSRSAPVSLTPTAWRADGELDFGRWIEQGRRLGVAGRGAGWWLGDWVRYGAARYGSKYARAGRVTGYDHKTLMNMVYVASRFEISRRRDNLSWSHHAELAALEPDEQERWLARAEAERLTVRQLRDELARSRDGADASHDAEAEPESPEKEEAAAHAAVCPRCGYALAEDEPEPAAPRAPVARRSEHRGGRRRRSSRQTPVRSA
jgi:hypothetical protein